MAPKKSLGVVADDLTGAMDTAGAFAARGTPTLVALSDTPLPDGWEVLCVNTQTRNAPVADVEEPVRLATRSLVQSGYSPLFKKIDSTLRGNVGAEIEAMMAEANAPYAFVVPAFPDTGRTQRDGILYVGDDPLKAAPEGVDRLSAPVSSSVVDLLKNQTGAPVGLVPLSDVDSGEGAITSAVRRLIAKGVRVITVDAIERSHLADITATLTQGFLEGLIAGSAGLAGALAQKMGHSQHEPARIGTAGPILVVAGSVNPVSVAQVDRLPRSTNIRLVTMAPATVLGNDSNRSQEAMRLAGEIRNAIESGEGACLTWSNTDAEAIDLPAVSPVVLSLRLHTFLSGLFADLGKRPAISGLVLVGGDTAYGVLTGLGAEGVAVEAELSPGIPMGTVLGGAAHATRIVTKAGGFGYEDALVRAVSHLHGD